MVTIFELVTRSVWLRELLYRKFRMVKPTEQDEFNTGHGDVGPMRKKMEIDTLTWHQATSKSCVKAVVVVENLNLGQTIAQK